MSTDIHILGLTAAYHVHMDIVPGSAFAGRQLAHDLYMCFLLYRELIILPIPGDIKNRSQHASGS